MHIKSSQIFKINAFSWLKTLFVLIFSGSPAILRNISLLIRSFLIRTMQVSLLRWRGFLTSPKDRFIFLIFIKRAEKII